MEMQSNKFAKNMMAQKLMSENKDNPFNSRFFQPSDAYSQQRTRPIQGNMTLGNLASYFMPFSKDIGPYDDSPRLDRPGGINIDFPPIAKDAVSGINKFGQAMRGQLSPEEIQKLAFDTSMNVTGGTLLGSKLLPNAMPRNALAMGLFSGSKSVKSLDDIKNKYPNVDLSVFSKPEGITLSKIVVPESARSEGIGSNVMKDLIKYADENNLPIALTPDSSFGGSKTRLKSFYRKFGFKDNKGRNKDFSFRETMIRQPQNKPGDIAKVVPPTDKSDGIFAFHGSGADFDEFKLSKIGTGEGNQAFGYGLYFTDSKDIAKFYKDALSDNMAETRFVFDGTTYERGSPEWKMLSLIKNKSIASAKSLFKILESDLADGKPYITAEQIKRYKNILDQAPKKSDIKKEQGRIYEVKIKAVMDDLIDYDKSLRQQNDKVKKILKPYYEYYSVAETADFGTLLESAYRHLPQDEFSERLAKEGIKGIKYQSGQLSGIKDSKATNFVIFDDKIIDIMKKYGIVGAVGVTAMQGARGSAEGDTLPPGQT